MALDKTGTITSGEPRVTDLFPAEKISEEELVRTAYVLEKKSEHPLARAVLEYAKEKGVESKEEAEDFQAIAGNGLSGRLGEAWLYGGNLKYIRSKVKYRMRQSSRHRSLHRRERLRCSL